MPVLTFVSPHASSISGPTVVLPFKVMVTGPVVWLSKGTSKYERGVRLLLSNVIRREYPTVTVMDADPLVTAMTETTSLAP